MPIFISSTDDLCFYIITYNVGDHRTFDSLGELHDRVLAVEPKGKAQWLGGLVVALACELSNIPGAVRSIDGRQFAEKKRIGFYQTAAKTGYGCAPSDFDKMIRYLLLPAASHHTERVLR